jgi:hypothetical protein
MDQPKTQQSGKSESERALRKRMQNREAQQKYRESTPRNMTPTTLLIEIYSQEHA